MENNIILGGGLAGLIVKFYNPSYKIITKDIGGQFASKFQLGPRFLHKTEETQRFVWDIHSEFNIKAKEKRVKVGYWYNNGLHDTCSAELMKQYFLKSRNISEADANIEKQGVMSSGKNEFDAFEIDYKAFAELMFSKHHDDFWLGLVKRIDAQSKWITCVYDEMLFSENYRSLISTIPLKWFISVVDTDVKESELKYSSIYFYKTIPENKFSDNEYDYIYFPELWKPLSGIYPWYRISFSNDRKECIYESSFSLNWSRVDGVIDSNNIEIGHIIDTDLKFVFPDIAFIGRMGKWKHDERLEKVVKDAQDMNAQNDEYNLGAYK